MASGETCPIEAPLDAPENLPSVISATSLSRPMPAMDEVGESISRIPVAALRSFIPDHDNIALLDLFAPDRFGRFLFGIEYHSRTGMHKHFLGDCRFLYNGAVLGQITLQDGQSAAVFCTACRSA